jgi:hypothetical protein
VINLSLLIEAFDLSQIRQEAAEDVFEDLSSFKNLFRNAVILAEIILGDMVLVGNAIFIFRARLYVCRSIAATLPGEATSELLLFL